MARDNLARRMDIPNSAFKEAKFFGISDTVERKACLPGIRLPNGQILISPNEFISGAVYTLFVKTLGGEKVGVKGKWVFVPDEDENADDGEEM